MLKARCLSKLMHFKYKFFYNSNCHIYRITNPDEEIDLPRPRRNSIDFSKESEEVVEKKFDNQVSDYSHRRHTDTMERRNLTAAKKEYTTQKIRQEWAEHEEQILGLESTTEETRTDDGVEKTTAVAVLTEAAVEAESRVQKQPESIIDEAETKTEESKSKKKRRRKSIMKKKAIQRKCSSSSSDIQSELTTTLQEDSSNDSSPKASEKSLSSSESKESETKGDALEVSTSEEQATPNQSLNDSVDPELQSNLPRSPIDTSLPTALSADGSPIQSDNEIDMMSKSASWKWGELPTHGEDSKDTSIEFAAKQAQRNSMLSNMFGFMKQSRSAQLEGVYLSDLDTEGMDPEVAALYFPQTNKHEGPMRLTTGNTTEDDRESGKGTSLPNSPSLMDGLKALDSDYDEDKSSDSK